MKNMILVLVIAILIGGSFSWPSAASACSCIEPPGIEEELSRSDAVFSGKVISVEDRPPFIAVPGKTVILQVGKIWKGISQSQVKIATGQGGGDCGYDFAVGQEYLVYAVKSDSYGTNSLSTIICDRTDVLSQAQDDVAVLGEGQKPAEEVDLLSRNGWFLPLAGLIAFALIAFTIYRRRKTIK